jgi:hypothetical protein
MTPKLPKVMTLLATVAVLIGGPILVVAVFDRPEPVHTPTPQELARDRCADKIMAEETEANIAEIKAEIQAGRMPETTIGSVLEERRRTEQRCLRMAQCLGPNGLNLTEQDVALFFQSCVQDDPPEHE